MEISERIRKARILLFDGWYQTSRKHLHLARLPQGKTGIEALRGTQQSKHGRRWAGQLGEESAGDQFLRTTRDPRYRMTVDLEVFRAYKMMGGGTYRDYRLSNRLTFKGVDTSMNWPQIVPRDMMRIRAKEWALSGYSVETYNNPYFSEDLVQRVYISKIGSQPESSKILASYEPDNDGDYQRYYP